METFIMSAYSKTGFFTKIVGVTFDNNNGTSRQQFIEELYEVFDITPKLLAQTWHKHPYDDKAVLSMMNRNVTWVSEKSMKL